MDHLSKQVYTKELSNNNWAICWHNSGDQPFTQRINWKHYTFLKGEYDIYDIWKHKIIGTTSSNVEIDIDTHDVLFYKLIKK